MSSSSSSTCCGGGGPAKMGFCPFSLFLFAATAGMYTYSCSFKSSSSEDQDDKSSSPTTGGGGEDPYTVVFVLGGPGAGKGTQCELLSSRLLNFAHLSAGDLLRVERNSGSKLADLINSKIAAGQIVPAEITVDLLERAMEKERKESGKTKFLIDGFPRSEGNVSVWDERMTSTEKAEVKFVLFLDCPEETMTGRLLERGKSGGRNDDKLDVIRKRFETFRGESMPIVERYEKRGKVMRVRADRAIEDVYGDVSKLMEGL